MRKKNIKNILSIDIDYVLEPCITLYEQHLTANHPFYVSYKEILDNPTDVLQHWRELAPLINKVAEISQKNYNEIIELFTYALFKLKKTESDKLYFADNHCTILTPLKKLYEPDVEFNILNIDHHHDIYYSEGQVREVDLYNLVSPADWLWYLSKYNALAKYTWISNENSEPFVPIKNFRLKEGQASRYVSLADYKKVETLPTTFDLIYVCKSPQWTPTKFHDLFENLKTASKNYFKKDFTQDIGYYSGGRKSTPFTTDSNDGVILDAKYAKGDGNDPLLKDEDKVKYDI